MATTGRQILFHAAEAAIRKGGTVTEAYVYLRVSSPADIEKGGFPRQREAVERYARANDIQIVEEFRDEGVSGKIELQNRPGLGALLSRLETNGVKLVIVEISDRLARDVVVNELIIREFQKLGVTVISASGGVNLTEGNEENPTAKLIRQILAAVAEFDRAVIILKTRAARDRIRKEKGKCEGRLAYGTKPGEEFVLATMKSLALEGKSAEQIAGYLNREKVLTRYGKVWNSGTVWKIINRPDIQSATTPKLERLSS